MKRWLLRLGIILLGLLAAALLAVACVRGDPAPNWGPSSGQLTEGSFNHGGLSRHFLYLEPKGDGPYPLLLALHGRFGDGAGEEKMSGLSSIAAREGFIVVFPDGYDKSWNDARQVGPAAEKKLDDTGYLVALAQEFIDHHHADPHRVYAAGLSNGAMMSLTLACRAADHFAGVVAVAGLWTEREECKPSQPVSVALMLGDHDPLVPYGGGAVSGDRGPVHSAAETGALFARLDGCGPVPTHSQLPDAHPEDGTLTELDSWSGCASGSAVRTYTVKNGGHTWPGGWQYLAERWVGKTSRDWSASEEIWAFLKDKRRD